MTARFRPGERVRVRADAEPRHHRTPAYVKGRVGEIERVCAPHGRPEVLAYADADTVQLPVYRVRLRQRDLWPDRAEAPEDALEIEIFEHWLEPAEARR